jgi:AsmA protein
MRVIGIVIAVILLIAVALPFLIDANQFRPRLESELSKQLGREVKLGNLKLSLLSGGVTASDISIADDPKFSRDPFLSAQSLTVGVDLRTLIFSRQLHVTGITIDHPNITLLQNPAGVWNFSSFGSKTVPAAPLKTESEASSLDLSVKLLTITDGRLVLGKTGKKVKPEVLDKVNIQVVDLSATTAFPFTLTAVATGGAQIKLDGKAGPLNPADSAATPFDAGLNVTHFDLAHSGFLPRTAFAGLVSVDGSVSSADQKVQVKGNVKAEQLVLAKGGSPAKKPVAFVFVLEHDLRKHAGELRRGNIQIGAASASLGGIYRLEGENTLVNMKLSAPSMAIPELEAMLPALDIVLPAGSSLEGGTAHADITIVGPTDRLVLDGSAGFNNTRLKGFDLGSRMALVTKLAGIKNAANTEIQNFSSNLHSDAQGVRTESISLVAPDVGELNGSGTVSAAHALDFNMTAKVRTGGVLAVMGSNTTVPFRISGTSSEPKFEPDVKGIVEGKLKSLEGGAAGKAAEGIVRGLFGGKKN